MFKKERKREPGEIEIQMEDVEIIMGNDIIHLGRLLNNSIYCPHCRNGYTGAIDNYRIYLNKLDDIIFEGQCTKCKNRVARYIETGETKSKAEIARHIRTVKKEFKTTKTKK
ncbi:MAG: hypothetical protein IT213_05085 [Cytophagales bacterium]|jgi:hypothetical protein|nr:hypothetical protein [Cytophagales bacterium]